MGWFHDVFGFSSQDITDPITKAVQDVVDPVKGVIGETGIGAGLGSLAALGFAPFTGGATLAMLPYMAAGGGMLGGGMEEEGNLLGNILSGGLQGYGLGSLGAALGGVNVAPMFGGAGVAGGAGPLAKGAGAAGGAGGAGSLYETWMQGGGGIPGSMGMPGIVPGGGALGEQFPWMFGQGIEKAFPLAGAGGGGQQGGGFDLGKILGRLGGILGGGAGAGAGTAGAAAGGIAPYSAYQPTPQLLPQLMEQYRGMPEYQQYQDIFQQGLGGLEQLGDIGPEYFEQFGLAPMAPVGQEYFEGFGPTSMEEALASEHFKYAAPEAQRAIAQRMSLQRMGESPVTAELMGEATGKIGVDIGKYLAGQGQRRAELGLQDIQNLRRIGEERAGRGLAGRTTAATARLGFDPTQMAMQFAGQAAPLQQQYGQAQQYNEMLRNAQKQAERGMFFDIASRGATALGQPQLGGLIGQAAPVFGGTYMGGGGQGVNPLQNIFQQLGLKNLFGTAQQV